MGTLNFPSGKTVLVSQEIDNWAKLRAVVDRILDGAELPRDTSASILLKPNLNNDLNGLTGNSTDLRLIRILIEALQSRGYHNLIVGDGPNVGIRRLGIDVLRRLAIDRLAEQYDVRCIDFNYDLGQPVELLGGQSTQIAATCLKSDYIINLPKLKTHAEAGLSLACKNLVGCNVGQNKKRVHDDLPQAIVRLNQILQPNLHIVDGLVAMEGNGPGDGLPRELGLLFGGSDPFLLDAAISRLVGVGPEALPHLAIARHEGLIHDQDWAAIKDLTPLVELLPAPPRRWLTRLLTRNSLSWFRDLTRPLFSNRRVIQWLHRSRIIQDIYEATDAGMWHLWLDDGGETTELEQISAYCPMELEIDEFRFDPTEERCIGCLYCYWLSPKDLVRIEGDLGYLQAHLDRYHDLVRGNIGEMWIGKGDGSNDERFDT